MANDIPPETLARADQEIADLDHRLDQGVAQYRREVAYRGEPLALATMYWSILASVRDEPDPMANLTWMLAAAMRRLAAH